MHCTAILVLDWLNVTLVKSSDGPAAPCPEEGSLMATLRVTTGTFDFVLSFGGRAPGTPRMCHTTATVEPSRPV